MTQIAIFRRSLIVETEVNEWLADPKHKDYKIIDIKICGDGDDSNTVMVIYEK